MTPNYVIVIENSDKNRSELDETHTPLLPTVDWQQSEVKILLYIFNYIYMKTTHIFEMKFYRYKLQMLYMLFSLF